MISKAKIDDLDIGKLKTVPIDLTKVSEVASKKSSKKSSLQETKCESKEFT